MSPLIAANAVACAVVGGVFFTFSTFVMAGLERLPEREGAAAMQSINVTAVTPAFMTLLFGTALLCVGVAGWAVSDLGDRRAPLALAGAATYLVGAIGVTIVANVPRNDRLAEAAGYWGTYVREWTAFNHVRTITGIAAAALLTAAVLRDDA